MKQMSDVRDAGLMPVRIQRRRVKGWRMPRGAVYVGRPSKWGNPYRIGMWRDFDARDAGLYENRTARR